MGYLFYIEGKTPPLGQDEEAALLRMVQTWTTFAKTGQPIGQDQGEIATLEVVDSWTPFTVEAASYADIGSQEIVPGVNPNTENMIFWNEIYEEFFRSDASSLYKIPTLLVLFVAIIHITFRQ